MTRRVSIVLIAVTVMAVLSSCNESSDDSSANRERDTLSNESVCSLLYFSEGSSPAVGSRTPHVFNEGPTTSAQLAEDEATASEFDAIADNAPVATAADLRSYAERIRDAVTEHRANPEAESIDTVKAWDNARASLRARCKELGLPDG